MQQQMQKQRRKGTFHTEEEAARAFDDAARELRGGAAHGAKFSLNFPTEAEKQEAVAAVEPAKPAASAAVAPARSSEYAGVCWDKRRGKWSAIISHEGKQKWKGRFSTEEEAARAFDDAAAAAGALRILRIVWVKVKHVFLKLLGTLTKLGAPS